MENELNNYFLKKLKLIKKVFKSGLKKIKILQRGISATVDNSNILGTETFPNIPHELENISDGATIQGVSETESAFQLDLDIEDGPENDHMSGIRDHIASLTIPSLRFVSICSIMIFFNFNCCASCWRFYCFSRIY